MRALTYVGPERIRRRKELQHLTDSIATVYPHISPDSAYAMAVEARRRHRGPRRRISTRVENDAEVLDWGLSKGFRRYLNEWVLDGTLKTDRASLYTPYFPIRNRLSHLQVDFNNDSIVIDGLRYKAGHSDLAVDGIVSDIRRSLAGRRNNPLKVNFSISSDTLDINQLAATAFAGAAFADRLRRGESVATARLDSEDEDLDRQFSDAVAASDTLAPILIPTNIDASIRVRANNILYSDLLLDDFSGEVLVYDGAVNLNGLHAASDAGDVSLSALYSAPRSTDIRCGMGLELKGFNIERFLGLVPAIDSIMPLMRDFSGIIDADIAATVDIDSTMNMELPTLDAAVHLTGENLAFIDPETYRTIGKWLRFRDRADNHISHMSVQLLVRNNEMQLFPFEFDIDRYRLGVVGHNDLAMNFDYHIAVLKSPLPFKFGVTVKGNPEHYKVRLGGAKFKPGMAAERVDMVDTVRINLVRQIQNVFRRGVSRSRFARLDTQTLESAGKIELGADTLSRSDSLMLINSTDIPPAIEP
ncbi:MAG: AsmA family protein [Muribaculaceae bacterium]|nr:AsmA family protein [Muribaculaceae bacterium]